MSDVYYPEFPCHMAKLHPGKAPLSGCTCSVCKHFLQVADQSDEWIPVVKNRDPYEGVLERRKGG